MCLVWLTGKDCIAQFLENTQLKRHQRVFPGSSIQTKRRKRVDTVAGMVHPARHLLLVTSAERHPPGLRTFPLKAFKVAMARSVWNELTKLDVRHPGCARALCLAAAYSRAIRSMVAAGIPVIVSAHSGVYLLISSWMSSQPTIYFLTKSQSASSFLGDDIDHRQQKGRIGTRADGNPFSGFGCSFRVTGIQVNQFCASVDGMR